MNVSNELKKPMEAALRRLDQYAHQDNFDLYDCEELVFQEFQEIQKTALNTLTNKNLSLKKTL